MQSLLHNGFLIIIINNGFLSSFISYLAKCVHLSPRLCIGMSILHLSCNSKSCYFFCLLQLRQQYRSEAQVDKVTYNKELEAYRQTEAYTSFMQKKALMQKQQRGKWCRIFIVKLLEVCECVFFVLLLRLKYVLPVFVE